MTFSSCQLAQMFGDTVSRCSVGFRFCAGQSSNSTPDSVNHFCMDSALRTGALLCWNRTEPSPKGCHQVKSTEFSRMSFYAKALITVLIEITGIAESLSTYFLISASQSDCNCHSVTFNFKN